MATPTTFAVAKGGPAMKGGNVRTVGSNFTTFVYNGYNIAYLESVVDSGQRAFSSNGAGYEFIRPLGYAYPQDIVTSRVLDGGTLTLTIREVWNFEVWEHLMGLTGATTITDIFARLAAQRTPVDCYKIITPPGYKAGTSTVKRYGKIYHNCTVVDITDGETIDIGALSVAKGLTIAYTNTTKLT